MDNSYTDIYLLDFFFFKLGGSLPQHDSVTAPNMSLNLRCKWYNSMTNLQLYKMCQSMHIKIWRGSVGPTAQLGVWYWFWFFNF